MNRWVTISGKPVCIESAKLTQSQQDLIHARDYQYPGDLDRCYKVTCDCGDEIYYVEHNGGKAIFDAPLGAPWSKHHCVDSVNVSQVALVELPEGTVLAFIRGLREIDSDNARIGTNRHILSTWDIALESEQHRWCLRLIASSKLHPNDFFFVNASDPSRVWSIDREQCKVISKNRRPEDIDDHLPSDWLAGK